MPPTSSYWIDRLRLVPHPGGGYIRETWRSSERPRSAPRGARRNTAQNASTAEYVLLESHQRLFFRCLRADEIWNFYSGSSLILTVLHPDGAIERIVLGDDPTESEQYQAGIPAGSWLGVEVKAPGTYALAGRICETDEPEETERGGEADQASTPGSGSGTLRDLPRLFPRHASVIRHFTPEEEG